MVEHRCRSSEVDRAVRLGHRGLRGLGDGNGDGAAPCCGLASRGNRFEHELVDVWREDVGAGTQGVCRYAVVAWGFVGCKPAYGAGDVVWVTVCGIGKRGRRGGRLWSLVDNRSGGAVLDCGEVDGEGTRLGLVSDEWSAIVAGGTGGGRCGLAEASGKVEEFAGVEVVGRLLGLAREVE